MNKIIIGIVALIAIGIAWFILNPGDTFDYVVTINDEVTQLEEDLAALDKQVVAGTLTAAQATEAKVRIITRLDAITTAAVDSESMQLTPAQRTQLANGLLRLKDALVTYASTLEAIENTAVQVDVETQLSNGNNSRNLSLIVADTISDVEETVQASVMDYETDVSVDTQIDAIVTEVEASEALEAEQSSEETPTTEPTDSPEATTTLEMNTGETEGEAPTQSSSEETIEAAVIITQ